MKKQRRLLIILLIFIGLTPNVVKAELPIDGTTFSFRRDICEYVELNERAAGDNGMSLFYVSQMSGGAGGSKSFSSSSSSGNFVPANCAEPLQPSGEYDGATVSRRVDPANDKDKTAQSWSAAMTKAYSNFVNSGLNGTSNEDRVIQGLVYRWLQYHYGYARENPTSLSISGLQCGGLANQSSYMLSGALTSTIYKNPSANYWNTSGPRYSTAKGIYDEAIATGNKVKSGTKYEDILESDSSIWRDEYEFKTTRTSEGSGEKITIEMTAKDVNKVFWNEFKAGCTNTSVSCQLVSASGSGNTGTIVVQVSKGGNSNTEGYGLYVETSIYDERDASSNIVAAAKQADRAYSQEMIVHFGPSTSYLHGGRRIPIPDGDNCSCEYNGEGKWTGRYLVNKLNPDGSYSQTSVDKAPDGVTCPGSCPEKHHCETPKESGDGKYYCSESSLGKGDGRPCSESEYNAQCKQVNCSPDVTIPSFCTSIDSNDTIKGTISDINVEHPNSCNNGLVNQVNTCVIQRQKDEAGNTFESTTDGISGNPYCKVWCKEKADFVLPAGRFSTSGEYFTLSMSITGERNCYVSGADDVSKGIDEDKFNDKMLSLQRQMIREWNEYNKWKYAVEHFGEEIYDHITTEHRSLSKGCCDPKISEITGRQIGCNDRGCKGETIKDDYYKFHWSYVIYSISGSNQYRASTSGASHQDGGPGSCPATCCAGDCVEGEPGDLGRAYSYFQSNMNSALAKLKSTINEIYTQVKLYNSCSGVVSNSSGTDLLSGSQNSPGWENNQNFNPRVDFEYHEDYLKNLEGVFKEKNRGGTSSTYKYCEKTTNNSKDAIDEEYNCKTSQSSSVPTEAKQFVICNSENCQTVNINLSKAGRVEKSKKVKVEYGPETSFSTYSPYGTVRSGAGGVSTLYTNLPTNALPVSLQRGTGLFPFKFTFSDVGQFNDNSSLGRLMGDSKSVLIAFNKLPETKTCTNESVSNTTEGGYVCQYINNCPDCTGRCEAEDNCTMETPDGKTCKDHCIGYCKNCVFGGTSAGYTFRVISLTNMQPNEQTKLEANQKLESYKAWNWNNDYKGQITKKEIESQNGNENAEDIYAHPQFSISLTISDLSKIREYNDDAGSFANAKLPNGMSNKDGEDNALYCQKITLNGKEYLVRCRSTFLDIIEEKKGYGTILERVTRDDDGFELFTDDSVQSITGCGKSNGYACLKERGIGPSWRVRKMR